MTHIEDAATRRAATGSVGAGAAEAGTVSMPQEAYLASLGMDG